MKKTAGRLGQGQRGAVMIEFVMTSLVFLLMLFLLMEVARLSYISAVLNLSITEAAKSAKNSQNINGEAAYNAVFKHNLAAAQQSQNRLWNFLAEEHTLRTTVTFIGTRVGLADNQLARYKLEYPYEPKFFPLPANWVAKLLKKEVIFVQEH